MGEVWKTFGHEPVKTLLDRQLATKKFSHAYLLSGPSGIGKHTLGAEFACRVLEVAPEKLYQHPDFFALGAHEEELSVEAMRLFTAKLSTKPFSSSHTVALIDNVNELNVSASNALLKTLEEPSPTTILILVSSGHVLPTVVSRCQVFSCRGLTRQESKNALNILGLNPVRESMYSMAGGSVGKLIRFARAPEEALEFLEKVEQMERVMESAVSEKLLAVNAFAEMESEELQVYLQSWMNVVRATLAENPGRRMLLERIRTGIGQFQTNMNKKLVLQKLFL